MRTAGCLSLFEHLLPKAYALSRRHLVGEGGGGEITWVLVGLSVWEQVVFGGAACLGSS